MKFNLLECFPPGPDGTHSMLPKQKIFFSQVMKKNGPKYVSFISGVGGGKTITGCVTMLAQAVLYPSTYLICRQYYPELRDTTYRMFKQICPKELILEDRATDMSLTIKAVGGKVSTILFRPLEEPDKLRSLNLGGFFIDEASQVSEEAFMLLQGRLRDSGGLRKGICISNPNGHDWLYRWFYKQDFFKVEEEKNKYFLIRGTSLDNIFLPDDYIDTMLNSWDAQRIEREVMGSFDTFDGAIYDEFRRDVHVIPPQELPKSWTRVIGLDAGYRNPAAGVFAAVDGDGVIYIYDEYYVKEKLVTEIVSEYLIPKIGMDTISAAYIDPATKQTRGQTGVSEFSTYMECMPPMVPLLLANNAVEAGIDMVKTFFKVNPKTDKPRIYISSNCVNLIEELVQYRWDPLTSRQSGMMNDKERPKKHNDHLCDALRYLIMSRPDPNQKDKVPEYKKGWTTPSKQIQAELSELRNPKPKDPFNDY